MAGPACGLRGRRPADPGAGIPRRPWRTGRTIPRHRGRVLGLARGIPAEPRQRPRPLALCHDDRGVAQRQPVDRRPRRRRICLRPGRLGGVLARTTDPRCPQPRMPVPRPAHRDVRRSGRDRGRGHGRLRDRTAGRGRLRAAHAAVPAGRSTGPHPRRRPRRSGDPRATCRPVDGRRRRVGGGRPGRRCDNGRDTGRTDADRPREPGRGGPRTRRAAVVAAARRRTAATAPVVDGPGHLPASRRHFRLAAHSRGHPGRRRRHRSGPRRRGIGDPAAAAQRVTHLDDRTGLPVRLGRPGGRRTRGGVSCTGCAPRCC